MHLPPQYIIYPELGSVCSSHGGGTQVVSLVTKSRQLFLGLLHLVSLLNRILLVPMRKDFEDNLGNKVAKCRTSLMQWIRTNHKPTSCKFIQIPDLARSTPTSNRSIKCLRSVVAAGAIQQAAHKLLESVFFFWSQPPPKIRNCEPHSQIRIPVSQVT